MKVIPKEYKHSPIQKRELVIIAITIKLTSQKAAVVRLAIQKKVLFM
jgi:hypothetical protein